MDTYSSSGCGCEGSGGGGRGCGSGGGYDCGNGCCEGCGSGGGCECGLNHNLSCCEGGLNHNLWLYFLKKLMMVKVYFSCQFCILYIWNFYV